jgi:hypothetical protein
MTDDPQSPAATAHAVGHGNSVAAWTAVGVIVLGSLISALAIPFSLVWLFWVGIVVIVIGAILGKVLSAMGFGEQPHH